MTRGRRPAIHPVNVRVGGFYRAPTRRELRALRRPCSSRPSRTRWPPCAWRPASTSRTSSSDHELPRARPSPAYPIERGRLVSTRGLDFAVRGVRRARRRGARPALATRCTPRWRDGGAVPRRAAGALRAQLRPAVATGAGGRGDGRARRRVPQPVPQHRRPRRRARLRARGGAAASSTPTSRRARRTSRCRRAPASGTAPREAPRGLLYHRYELDADGTILGARIVPPTSQNQARHRGRPARGRAADQLDLDDDELQHACEQAIRNYDPCISCATHFLDLTVDRT